MSDLDPRALEEATDGIEGFTLPGVPARVVAASAITAYLAVTQPIVETVEELEGLEVGVVVVDKHGPLKADVGYRGERIWYYAGNETPCTSADIALPARAIWRPHENP